MPTRKYASPGTFATAATLLVAAVLITNSTLLPKLPALWNGVRPTHLHQPPSDGWAREGLAFWEGPPCPAKDQPQDPLDHCPCKYCCITSLLVTAQRVGLPPALRPIVDKPISPQPHVLLLVPAPVRDDDQTLGEYVMLYSSHFQHQGRNKFIEGCHLPNKS